MSAPKPENWFKFLTIAQKYFNATPSRSTGRTSFQLMFGTNVCSKEDLQIWEMIECEWVQMFEEECESVRLSAKEKNCRDLAKECKRL